MAFRSSIWTEINGGNPELDTDSGRSKRLCTGLSNGSEPWSTVQSQWAGSQILPEQSSYDPSRYDSNTSGVLGRSASAVDFDGVSRQRVGNVQGQTLFQNHRNWPWPSSEPNPRPSWLEAVDTTPSSHHQVPDIQAPPYPASKVYDSRDPPSNVISLQPTPKSNIPYGGNPDDQYPQSDVGTISQHVCQDPSSDGNFELEKSGDTGYENTSYELCLGLVGQICFWNEVLGPRNSSRISYKVDPGAISEQRPGQGIGYNWWTSTIPCHLEEQFLGSEPNADRFTDQHGDLASIKCHTGNRSSRSICRQTEDTRSGDHCPLYPQTKRQ